MYNKNDTIEWLLKCDVLQLGDFTLKSGRKSSYFFNLGKIYNGMDIKFMASRYYDKIKDAGLVKTTPIVFGPAYKGIPLSVAVSRESAEDTAWCTLSYCFDRKEEKNHGDGGKLVGSPLKGKDVIIIDDVITSGGSIIEASDKISKHGGKLVGIIVFVDRMEKAPDNSLYTAREYIETTLNVPVLSVLTAKEIAESDIIQDKYKEEAKLILTALSD